MPSLLPHDLCHGRSSSHWLLAVIDFQLSYSRSWKMMLWKVLHSTCNMHSICNMPAPGNPIDCSPSGSSVHGDSPDKKTEVGCHALLQGVFPIQGSNPGHLHCRWIPYHLSHEGSPRVLEGVAYPFSRGTSWPRNWTRVSCITGGFFTSWATREAPFITYLSIK